MRTHVKQNRRCKYSHIAVFKLSPIGIALIGCILKLKNNDSTLPFWSPYLINNSKKKNNTCRRRIHYYGTDSRHHRLWHFRRAGIVRESIGIHILGYHRQIKGRYERLQKTSRISSTLISSGRLLNFRLTSSNLLNTSTLLKSTTESSWKSERQTPSQKLFRNSRTDADASLSSDRWETHPIQSRLSKDIWDASIQKKMFQLTISIRSTSLKPIWRVYRKQTQSRRRTTSSNSSTESQRIQISNL